MDQLITVRGQPVVLDAVFRPIARWSLYALGALGSVALALAGWWFWLPIPVVAAHLLFELIFYVRGDRPVVVKLRGSHLSMVDAKGGHQFEVDLAQIEVAGLGIRHGTRGRDQAFVVAYREAEVLFALRLISTNLEWPDHAVPLDALQPVFGGNAGIVRGLGPQKRIVRQTLKDDRGELARALIDRIPGAAWGRAAARVWRGEAPPVDFMGLHVGDPAGLLVLDGEEVTLRHRDGSVDRWPRTADSGGRGQRLLDLMGASGEHAQYARLPLVVWAVADGVHLVLPSPHAGRQGDEHPIDDEALHTHLAEGTLLAWWLLTRQPDGALPSSVRLGIRDAMITTDTPHPDLLRHVKDLVEAE